MTNRVYLGIQSQAAELLHRREDAQIMGVSGTNESAY